MNNIELIKILVEALKSCQSDWAEGCYGTRREKDYDSEKVADAIKLAARFLEEVK